MRRSRRHGEAMTVHSAAQLGIGHHFATTALQLVKAVVGSQIRKFVLPVAQSFRGNNVAASRALAHDAPAPYSFAMLVTH